MSATADWIDLGACTQCRGPLCVSGDQVQCLGCGAPQFNHPMMAEIAAAKLAPIPQPIQTPPQDYAVTWLQRIQALERLTKAQAEEIAALTGRAEALESQAATHRKR